MGGIQQVNLSQRLDRVCLEFGNANENKQALWDAINQFKRDPAADICSEFRALRDAAFSARTQINGPQPDGKWTIWQCIGNHGERFDAIDKQFRELPDMVKETLRDVLLAQLQPLLDSAKANIDNLLKDNSELNNKACSLSDAIGKHGERLDTLEKQISELPDKAKEVLLGSILDELQPHLDSAKADIASLQTATVELRNGIDSLRTELSSCQTGLKQDLASTQETNSKLKAELDSLRTEFSSCQTSLRQELVSAQEAISNIKRENASLRAELSSCQASLKQEVASNQETICKRKAEIDSLRAELSACQAGLEALLNPPKKQGFFKQHYFRLVKFFKRKTSADTSTHSTPPPKGM